MRRVYRRNRGIPSGIGPRRGILMVTPLSPTGPTMPPFTRRQFLRTASAVTAGGLLTPVAAADGPKPLRILFFGGDLPAVEKALAAEYAIMALKGGQKKDAAGSKEDSVAGLEQLAEADLWVGSAHKRTYPSAGQLDHFKKYLAAGKPFVGYRAASHVFENWLRADQAVFGATYGGHHLLDKDPVLVIETAKGQADHPILKGLEPPPPRSGSYKYTDLAPDVTVLLYSGLKGDMMPHTWVRENKETKGRVFYTRYDAKDLEANEVCRTIFLRGIVWALNRDLAPHRKKG